MTKKTYKELREQRLAANEKLGDIYQAAANRELTAEEQIQVENLNREIDQCEKQMRGINLDTANLEAKRASRNADIKKQFRELLLQNAEGKSKRTVLLDAGTEIDGTTANTTGNIEASGAIMLTIHDLIPTLNEGLGLPASLNIVTGVVGDEVWPVGINDVEMEEVGEIDALSEQNVDFANITPNVRRSGLKVYISNAAIDNAAFDVLAYVQRKFDLAVRKYLAKKIYSQAAWNGIKGPFSGLTAAGTITLGGGEEYKSILNAVAAFTNKGFDADGVCLVIDATTEADLKATPKASGQGGFIIENGKLAGYNYIVSHYINTTLSGTSLVSTSDRFIGIGYFEWLAVQQHGQVRLTLDAITMADRNITRIILNTAWSITDLSTRINGGEETSEGSGVYKTQGFALYTVEDAE